MFKWKPNINSSNLYILPDLNGNNDLLNKILKRILPLRKSDGIKDKIIFLGDFIDRNIKSCQVLDRLISLKKDAPDQCIFLIGNHEDMLLKAMNKDGRKNLSLQDQANWYKSWLLNGGAATLQGYLERAKFDTSPWNFPRFKLDVVIPKAHIDFLQNDTVPYYETDKYIFVHGGINPNISVADQEVDEIIWDRDLIKFVKDCITSEQEDKITWDKTIIVGHTPQKEPIIHEKFMGLDCGLKKLICVELNSMQAIVAIADIENKLIKFNLKKTTKEDLI